MLEILRKGTKTWIAKILFLLLILSFAVWGVGDMVQVAGSDNPAIVAGSVEVSPREVAEEYRRQVKRLQAAFGGALTDEQARDLGLLEQTIDQMTSRALLDQAARDFDMVTPDETVRQVIAANPAFRNDLGQFDPYTFRQTLAQAGFSEQQYVAVERANLQRAELVKTVANGVTPPKPLVETLFRHRNERRVAETLLFPASAMPAPEAPAEEVLVEYHKTHSDRFMAPEYRAVTALIIRPADVAHEVRLTGEMIEEAYQQRLADYQQPEQRKIRQILLDDEAQAATADALVKEGKTLEGVARELQKDVIDLGWVDEAALPAEVAEGVFAIPAGRLGEPMQSPLGWHLFEVKEVKEGHSRGLAEVREELTADLTNEKAVDVLYDLVNRVDDSLGGGAGIEEAAAQLNLPVVKVAAVDASGKTPEGEAAEGVPEEPQFLAVAFKTQRGMDSFVEDLGGNRGFFVLRVDEVMPAALRPFETVRDEVLKGWQAERQAEIARAKAAEAAEKLREGADAAALAVEMGAEMGTTPPFTRNPGPMASPVLATEMFQLPPGGVAVVPAQEGSLAARLKEVVPAEADAPAVAETAEQIEQSMAADLVDSYVEGLRLKYRPQVNRSAIEEWLR